MGAGIAMAAIPAPSPYPLTVSGNEGGVSP